MPRRGSLLKHRCSSAGSHRLRRFWQLNAGVCVGKCIQELAQVFTTALFLHFASRGRISQCHEIVDVQLHNYLSLCTQNCWAIKKPRQNQPQNAALLHLELIWYGSNILSVKPISETSIPRIQKKGATGLCLQRLPPAISCFFVFLSASGLT